MKMIDAQLHCFYSDTAEHPWPPGATSIHGPEFTVEQALAVLDEHNVQGAVLVPPSWNGWDNEYSLKAARAQPKRFGVMGRFNIELPDAPERLKTWRQQPGMLGLRLVLVGDPWMSLFSEEQSWFWQIAEETRLPIMARVPGNTAFHPILARYPELRLIIDHAGRDPRAAAKQGLKDDAVWADADQMYALARYKNVSVKLTSMPCFSTQTYPFANLHPHIKAIYDHFGPKRMLWGSDASRLPCTYDENMRLFTEALDFLSEEDKDWVMWRAARAALDWDV